MYYQLSDDIYVRLKLNAVKFKNSMSLFCVTNHFTQHPITMYCYGVFLYHNNILEKQHLSLKQLSLIYFNTLKTISWHISVCHRETGHQFHPSGIQ